MATGMCWWSTLQIARYTSFTPRSFKQTAPGRRAAGEIDHAIRFTAPQTRKDYVWPARHFASTRTSSQYPPMGQRFRLRADFNASGMSPEVQVVVTALKRYGIILADNGSRWFLSGAPDERWDDAELRQLMRITGADFEAVDMSSLMIDPDSGRTK